MTGTARFAGNPWFKTGACWLALSAPAMASPRASQNGPSFILQTAAQDSPQRPALSAAGLQAWVKTEHGWQEVPVQVDERDKNGDYVLENGIPFTAHGGDGLLNGSDEIVFALPAGSIDFSQDQAIKKLQQAGAGLEGRRALTGWTVNLLSSTSGARQRSFQVLITNNPQSRSLPRPQVTFDPAAHTVTTSSYRYTFNSTNPAAVGELSLTRSRTEGGSTKGQPELPAGGINQGGGFAVWLRPPWGFPALHRSDRDLNGAIESWRAGPVRAIVAVGSRYSALWSTINAHLFSELVFYRDRFQIPSVIDITFSPDRLLGHGSGFAYGMKLANSETTGIQLNKRFPGEISARHPSGLVLRARTDPALVAAGVAPAVWIDPGKTISGRQNVGDPEQDIPAEVAAWFRQTSANIGFFVDISRMKKGRYDFSLDLESQGEANLPHTDFLICKSVWTPLDSMKSAKTVAPVPKQESKAQHK
ncbi:MAG: hypothetical protein RIQ81_844 [Pseudomonadota bacterium]|jgi:hypothetical protein